MEALQSIFSAWTNFFEAVQLNNDLEHLRTTLPKVHMLICRSEWGMFKVKETAELAELLTHLKDTTYDAKDLLRELDDQALRQRIEDADRSRAGQLLSFSLNIAKIVLHGSKARIKDTQNKLNMAVAQIEGMLNLMGLTSMKPSQIMPETTSVVSAPAVFGRDREQDLLIEMLGVTIALESQQDLLGVPPRDCRFAVSKGKRAAASNDAASTSRAKKTKSNSGRARLAETNCTNNVSVISIVGIGGMGKTTLAQLIYNDPRVERHFGVRMWVCVSDFFDKRRITKKIINSIPGNTFNTSCSLNTLQAELKDRLKMFPKFLLVLDDIWPNANAEWEAFYAPLRNGPQGSMILVTTRCPVVATRVSTSNYEPVQLEGLPIDILWDFFKERAFGTNKPKAYPRLQEIGMSICNRLCGSPLAAETVTRILNKSLEEEDWRWIQKRELWDWEPQYKKNEILHALQVSYLYLPQDVKKCFLICSMFRKGYSFERDEIIDIWEALGLLTTRGCMRPEDVGVTYLDELRNRFLLRTDPEVTNESRYVMNDLIHDMATSFCTDECLVIQDLRNHHKSRMQNTARHMSIVESRMQNTVRHMPIEECDESLVRMGDIQHLDKLRSLRLEIRFDVEIPWFSQLSNILYLSLPGCNLVRLPESICELNSLRYLDISHSSVQELPVKFCCLYSLQVLDARHSSLTRIHQDVTKLINLRQLALPAEASQVLSSVSGLGNLSCLRNLSDFSIAEENGRRIDELKFMNQLSGTLCIGSLTNVGSEEEAAEARLDEKQYLKELVLQWRPSYISVLMPNENRVLEGLCPHSGIECLKVVGFGGDRFPSWFKPEHLPTLRSLELSLCGCLESLSIPCFDDGTQAGLTGDNDGTQAGLTGDDDGTQAGLTGDDGMQHASSSSSSSISHSNSIASFAFTSLTALHVHGCLKLTNLEQFLTPEKLPSIKSIMLEKCRSLASIPVHSFVGFDGLQDLKICDCPELQCPQEMVLPGSLRRLCIVRCNGLDRSFPACLDNLTSLTFLQLASFHSVKCIPLNSICSNMLKCLVIHDCRELSSIGELHGLASIQHMELSECPKLAEVQLPFANEELRSEENELLKYIYTDTY